MLCAFPLVKVLTLNTVQLLLVSHSLSKNLTVNVSNSTKFSVTIFRERLFHDFADQGWGRGLDL